MRVWHACQCVYMVMYYLLFTTIITTTRTTIATINYYLSISHFLCSIMSMLAFKKNPITHSRRYNKGQVGYVSDTTLR